MSAVPPEVECDCDDETYVCASEKLCLGLRGDPLALPLLKSVERRWFQRYCMLLGILNMRYHGTRLTTPRGMWSGVLTFETWSLLGTKHVTDKQS
jgi:hypothetical protein